jgi:hypothetical protein
MAEYLFEVDVMVAQWEKQRRKFVVFEDEASQLLAQVSQNKNPHNFSIEDLRDYIAGNTEFCTLVKLREQEGEVKALIRELSVSAWKDIVPWTVKEYVEVADAVGSCYYDHVNVSIT